MEYLQVKVLFLRDWLLLPGEYDDNDEDHRQKEDEECDNVNRDFRCLKFTNFHAILLFLTYRVDWLVAVPLIASVVAIFDAVAFFGHEITFERVKAPVLLKSRSFSKLYFLMLSHLSSLAPQTKIA